MKNVVRLTAGMFALALGGTAGADTPANGLGGLAIDPAGETLLVAGDTRTIYALDRETLEVVSRHWIKTSPVWMEFRGDGEVVFLRDTSGKLQALDPKTFESLWSVDRTEGVDYAPASDQIAYAKHDRKATIVTILDAQTFEEVTSYRLEEFRTAGMAMADDGGRVSLISTADKRPDEEKEKTPSDMRGLERSKFRQEHDQRGSKLAVIPVAAGLDPFIAESWYSANNLKGMHMLGDVTYILTFTENTARMYSDGEIEMFETGASNHYGAMLSPETGMLISGSLGTITIKSEGKDEARKLKLEKLPGWPEYVIRFASGPDGLIYGTTTGYRVVVIDPEKGTVQASPVH